MQVLITAPRSPQVPALRLLSQRTDVVLYDMYVPDDLLIAS